MLLGLVDEDPVQRRRDAHAADVDLVDGRRRRQFADVRERSRLRVVRDELEHRRTRGPHRLRSALRVDDLDRDGRGGTAELGKLDDVRVVRRLVRLVRGDRRRFVLDRCLRFVERGNRDLDHFRDRRDRRDGFGGPRRDRRGRRGVGARSARQSRLHGGDRGVQRRRIRRHAATLAQFAEPLAERGLRDPDHVEDRRRHRALLVEQPVVDALDVPRELAQLLQADHPSRALERVESATHGAQRLAVARVVEQRAMLVADRVEHLRGLGEVDLEELGVEILAVGLEEPPGLVGDFRGGGRTGVGDRGRRFGERRAAAAVELLERGLGLRDELGVADQLGVVAESGELGAQRLARDRVGRREPRLVDQRGQRRAEPRDRRLDRLGLLDLHRLDLAKALRDQRRDQSIAIRTLLLDRLDVEAKPGQRLREALEVVVGDHGLRVRVVLDLRLAGGEQPLGIVEAQDREGAADLLAVLRERGEVGALAVVAEEGVEHLLHAPQVRLDLAPDLGDQHALLGALAHFVERGRLGSLTRASGPRRVEAREHRVDLLREVRRERRVVLEGALGEQKRRRVLHRERLRHAGGRHPVEPLDQRRGELHHRAVLDLGRLRVDRRQRPLELRQVLRASRRELEPRVLRLNELLARLAQERLDAHEVGVERLGRRDQPRELERPLHRLHLRADGRADRHVVEHLAAQPVGRLRAPLDDAADLEVDAGGELLDAESGVEPVAGDRLEQRADAPPERPQAALRRRVLDARDRLAHRLRAFRVAAQPREEPALVGAALLHEVGRKLRGADRLARRDLRRARRQVGVEELGGRRRLRAPRELHRLVLGEELERDGRDALDQLVQEDAELAARAVDGLGRALRLLARQRLEPRELALELVGVGDDGIEADHLDRARGLVNVRARVLEGRVVAGIRAERRERLQTPRDRLVDLVLHPGQRSQVEIG